MPSIPLPSYAPQSRSRKVEAADYESTSNQNLLPQYPAENPVHTQHPIPPPPTQRTYTPENYELRPFVINIGEGELQNQQCTYGRSDLMMSACPGRRNFRPLVQVQVNDGRDDDWKHVAALWGIFLGLLLAFLLVAWGFSRI